jgi:hypothetical protein
VRAARESAAGRPVETTARRFEHLYLSLLGEACDSHRGAHVSDSQAA